MKIGNFYNNVVHPHFGGTISDSEPMREVMNIGKKAAIDGQRCANNFYNTLSFIQNDGTDSVFDVIKYYDGSEDMYVPVYGGYNGLPASSKNILAEIVKMGETLFDRTELCKPSSVVTQIREQNKKILFWDKLISFISNLF